MDRLTALQHQSKQLEGARRFEFEILAYSKDPSEKPEHPGEWQVRPLQGALMFDGQDGPTAVRDINRAIGPYILQLHMDISRRITEDLNAIRSLDCAAQSLKVVDVCRQVRHLMAIQRSPVRASQDERSVELDSSWCYRANAEEDAQQVADKLNSLLAPVVSDYIKRVCHCMQDSLVRPVVG